LSVTLYPVTNMAIYVTFLLDMQLCILL